MAVMLTRMIVNESLNKIRVISSGIGFLIDVLTVLMVAYRSVKTEYSFCDICPYVFPKQIIVTYMPIVFVD